MKIKQILIRVLLKLLSIPLDKVNEKRIRLWFWANYPQQGFQDYVKRRDATILQELGNYVSRDDYLIKLGQRIEIGLLLSFAKKAYEKVEKERVEKVQELRKQAEERQKQEELKKKQQTQK